MGHKGISRKGRIAADTHVVTGDGDHRIADAPTGFGAHGGLAGHDRTAPDTMAEAP